MATQSSKRRIRSLYELLEAFPTESACTEHLARVRWPDGPECPHCGTVDRYYRIGNRYKCAFCRAFFSVRHGTIFADSNIKLRKWYAAIFLFVSNRKGISSHQLARELGVRQETAWFMLCRIRHVADKMSVEVLKGIVEVDECFVGGRLGNMHKKKRRRIRDLQKKGLIRHYGKQIVVGAVERGGYAITQRIPDRDKYSLGAFIMRRIYRGSDVFTDELASYQKMPYHKHSHTNHDRGEYVNGNVHSQTIESYWALVKRAHKGVYHYWSDKHFDLYLREFELRWNIRKLPEHRKLDIFLANVNGTKLTKHELTSGRRKRPRRLYERNKRQKAARLRREARERRKRS